MTEPQARSWAYAAAAAGVIANALFIAFYTSFAGQHFAEPHGVTAILGSAADHADIPQNALLAVISGVVFRFLSRQQRSDQVLRIAGAMAFATAAAQGVPTVTGLLPGISAVAVGAVLAATVCLLAIAVAAIVWTGLIAGCLAWISISLWVLALGRALAPSRAVLPIPETVASAY
jgi:hypothetical protein